MHCDLLVVVTETVLIIFDNLRMKYGRFTFRQMRIKWFRSALQESIESVSKIMVFIFFKCLLQLLLVYNVCGVDVTYFDPKFGRNITYCVDDPIPNNTVEGVHSFSSCFVGTTLFDLVDRQYRIADERKLSSVAEVIPVDLCPIELESGEDIDCGNNFIHYDSYPMISYSALGTHELAHWGSVYIDNKNDLWIVAVRGTWFSSDWLSNFFYGYAKSEYRDGKVHSGFLKSSNELYYSLRHSLLRLNPLNAVEREVPPTYLREGHSILCPNPNSTTTVVFSGHSLGGAKALDMALQYSIECETEPHRVIAILYHAPKVGDSEFIQSFKNPAVNFSWNDIANLACGSDIIPYVGHWKDFMYVGVGDKPAEFQTILYRSNNVLSDYWFCYSFLNLTFTVLLFAYANSWIADDLNIWSLVGRPASFLVKSELLSQRKILPYAFMLLHCIVARCLAVLLSHQTRERGNIIYAWEHFQSSKDVWWITFISQAYWRFAMVSHYGSQLNFVNDFVFTMTNSDVLWRFAWFLSIQSWLYNVPIVSVPAAVLLLYAFIVLVHSCGVLIATYSHDFGSKEKLAMWIWILNIVVHCCSNPHEVGFRLVYFHLVIFLSYFLMKGNGVKVEPLSSHTKWIIIDQGIVSLALKLYVIPTQLRDTLQFTVILLLLVFARILLKPIFFGSLSLLLKYVGICILIGCAWQSSV